MLTILLGLKIKFGSDDVGNHFFVVSILPVAIAFLVRSCDMLVGPVTHKKLIRSGIDPFFS